MVAVLWKLIYLGMRTVEFYKSLISKEFLIFSGPCYSARRHVIPQFCGIYQ